MSYIELRQPNTLPTIKQKRRKNKSIPYNDRDQLAYSGTNVAASSVENERLQSDGENSKHHTHSHNCGDSTLKPLTATTTAAPVLHGRAKNLCNNGNTKASLIDCCRDVNCYLNSNACHSYLREGSTPPTRESSTTGRSESVSSSRAWDEPSSVESSKERTPDPSRSKSDQTILSGAPKVEPDHQNHHHMSDDVEGFVVKVNLDIFTWGLFVLAFLTRFYKLSEPRNVVFDELHYGKSVAHYIRNIFFFDQHPPLGKQIIAAVADSIGYNGNYTGTHIGSPYADNFPIFWMRFVPALCGSILPSTVYTLLKEAGVSRWCSLLGGLLIVFDNSMLTQSRLILMESMLFVFCTLGLICLLKFQKAQFPQPQWFAYGVASASLLTLAVCVKYAGFYTYCLAIYLILKYLWDILYDATKSDCIIALEAVVQFAIFTFIPVVIYVSVFYVHLQTLYKAGPHDAILTSAFQASLEGGLAAITRNQPLNVAHGSQITLRHTYGRRCWLHSHAHVYPVRYPDDRGSSHQQQVTCYPFKDVNNWWIIKKPDLEDVVVGEEPDVIHHGDIIQLVHGITSRALNSHDVAAPLTPQCQEVSCYIDYEINMKGELLWRVDILNRETEGSIWKTIKSEVRLIHVSTGAALKFSGRVLPEWGFNQHEVVADRATHSKDATWNVEEHRYTKDADQEERGRQMLMAQMIPTEVVKLSFIEKFMELQMKMILPASQVEDHMYSSEPLEWPLLTRGIAYWLDPISNRQIHLLGNLLVWYTGTLSIFVYFALFVFYLLRRQRLCFDIDDQEWQRLLNAGHIYFVGYLMHYLPYFFVDRVLFLHHYLPAFLFKIQLMCFVIDHIDYLLRRRCGSALWVVRSYRMAVLTWLVAVIGVYIKFLPISYGLKKLTIEDIVDMRWKDTWEFMTHRLRNKHFVI